MGSANHRHRAVPSRLRHWAVYEDYVGYVETIEAVSADEAAQLALEESMASGAHRAGDQVTVRVREVGGTEEAHLSGEVSRG